MGYLYEAMDRAKEAIHMYYEHSGDQGEERLQMIWGVIDERWNNTLHRPIHVAGLYLKPTLSYTYSFKCVQRMVPSAVDRIELSQELEQYKRASGLFGFEIAVK